MHVRFAKKGYSEPDGGDNMARENLCTGCQKNFIGASVHAMHRIGSIAGGSRGCLSTAQMLAKGFSKTVEHIKHYQDGKPVMETWHAPMNEQQRTWFLSHKKEAIAEEAEDLSA